MKKLILMLPFVKREIASSNKAYEGIIKNLNGEIVKLKQIIKSYGG